jgi:hypothetical protein
VLFHIKQTHSPADCPYGKGGSRSLFDYESKDVTIHGYWLAFPQHTIYLVSQRENVHSCPPASCSSQRRCSAVRPVVGG